MLRNSGMRPIPSGNSRQTSSVTPGRMVGLIMPTTPRQLENAIRGPFYIFPPPLAGESREGPAASTLVQASNTYPLALRSLASSPASGGAMLPPIDRLGLDEEAPQDVINERVVLLLEAGVRD